MTLFSLVPEALAKTINRTMSQLLIRLNLQFLFSVSVIKAIKVHRVLVIYHRLHPEQITIRQQDIVIDNRF